MLKKAILIVTVLTTLLSSETFRVANYNVENLFDLKYDGTEYKEYIPFSSSKWNRDIQQKKLINISKIIKGVNPDIIALQEIESEDALKSLIRQLRLNGLKFKYYTIALQKKKRSSVTTALLSKFPIKKSQEIAVSKHPRYRDILEVKLDIKGEPLFIYVNHWKAKSGGESHRIKSAKALKKRLDSLSANTPYILTGDFNSDYNEFKTFRKNRKLNDTKGQTGINHTLNTLKKGNKFVTLKDLKNSKDGTYLYNLWLELPKKKRWSHKFRGKGGTLDNMIISKGLVDGKGVEYIEKSFGVYRKGGVVDQKGRIQRWKMSSGKRKAHKGYGFSDHLPIYADFKR